MKNNLIKSATFVLLGCLLSSCGTCEQCCSSCKTENTKETNMKTETEAPKQAETIKKVENEPKVITTSSGLKYEVLTAAPANAASPTKGQKIKAHYTGWLENGTKFDSSVDRGTPLAFNVGVGQVIPGWDEALLSMKVGEKRKLTIPSKLAYGARGAGGVIPPNATLIFEVELVSVA